MQSGLINSSMPGKALMPMLNGRPDYALADALKKVPPQAQLKAKGAAQDFESVFLNSMFSQMTSGIKGEGPLAIRRAPGCGARC
jgi:Rod binding domain-containing protein